MAGADAPMVRILGIDPGSVITGWGVVESNGHQQKHIAHGCLKVGRGDMPQRLHDVFTGLGEVVEQWQPAQVAIETVFVRENIASALKLGQARGAAICAVTAHGLPVSEYAPTRIKQALVGRGLADKQQVAHMVGILLSLNDILQADAADALAVAICHGHTQHSSLYDVRSRSRRRRR